MGSVIYSSVSLSLHIEMKILTAESGGVILGFNGEQTVAKGKDGIL